MKDLRIENIWRTPYSIATHTISPYFDDFDRVCNLHECPSLFCFDDGIRWNQHH
ncbi:MAG: hypothetical protein MJZ41_01275 [Bacteroidaceae bacterium]|nr:hypothetical protein [Bacteroidaceae bacterium]